VPTPTPPHDAEAHFATLKLSGRSVVRSDPPAHPITPTVPQIPVRPEVVLPHVRGYEILSVVGSGGMAIVFEARHRDLNRRVAIKMLRGAALADPDYRERFRAEAEAIARLQHPNIIQVFEVGAAELSADGSHPGPFLALEFVDGGSLMQRTSAPQTPGEAARVVETLARAAAAAHRLGVVHRDLKPSNVLLTRDGTPKIADFGIAKRIDTEPVGRLQTRDGTVMGTPEYMSPEQLQGAGAAPTIDVYALGVILYELLTARVPFQGATFAETMLLVLREEPVPPRRLQPGVPRDLETICLKCLEKNPAKRYESAEALADDLARWAEGRPIRARAVGPVGRAVRWSRLNPAVAGLSVAVLIVALTGVSGVVWKWSEAENNAINADANAAAARTKTVEANRNADRERWERYRVSVFAASSALRLHDTSGARHALDAAPEEHRDWVWRVLHAQLDRSSAVLGSDPITRVVFTPDRRRALLYHAGTGLRVWDLVTRAELRPTEPLPTGTHLGISPDGTAVTLSPDGHEVRIYEIGSWRLRATARGHTGELRLARFSPDGARLLTFAADETVRTWDVRTGAELHSARLPGYHHPQAVCPDHKVIVTGLNGSHDAVIWDVRTGRELARLDGHTVPLRGLWFSPAGDRVVTVEDYPTNAMRVWEVPSGRLLAVLTGHTNEVNAVRFSPDGNRVLSCSLDRTVRLWDLTNPTGGERAARWMRKEHTGRVEDVTFSPDGRRVVSASYDRTLAYWDAETGNRVAVLQGHTNHVFAAAFGPDGRDIVSVSTDGTMRLWDVAELDDDYALRGHTNFVYNVAFHPDGNRIASCGWDGTARVWDPTSRTELVRMNHTGPTTRSRIVASLAFHPDGRSLVTLCRDDLVRVWNPDTGEELRRLPTVSANWADSRLTFDPRGELLAVGRPDGRVGLWDANKWVELGLLGERSAQIRDVAISPDGRLLAYGLENTDRTVRVWDLAAREQRQVLTAHRAAMAALTWNRAGTILATGAHDGTVRFWDTVTWRQLGEPLKQGANVYAVAFTPDGKLLAVGCGDNLIRVWDVATQQELAELSGHTDYVHGLAFSPDGTRLVSASGDRTLRVWDSLSPAERRRR
jgi:WD40 repeat protein/tRNA A-37 threonylcarbamoyl transferase component Bud32